MPKHSRVADQVEAAVKALNQAENAIEPLEMHYLASPSVAPAYVYWAWAALTLGAIMLVVWASAGAPHPAIPWAGLVLAVLGGLVAAWHGLRARS